MKVKVLFFDIDGTLIDNAKGIRKIPEEVRVQLNRIQTQGNKLFICTGRPKLMLNKDMKTGFDGFVLFNGAYIEINDQSIYENRMDPDLVRKTIDLLESMHRDYMLESATHIYIKREFQELYQFFASLGQKEIFTFDYNEEEILSQIIKIECNIDDAHKQMIDEYLNSDLGFSINYDTHGTDFAFEFYSPTNSKAVGIQKTIEYLGVDPRDCYAFGDGSNDLPMFEVCGNRIAMGNAVDELKNKADLVCDSIENLGLAKVLEELF